MNRPQIVILTGNHACHNPRAWKEANTLAKHGYEILWLGGWFDPIRAERDRNLLRGVNWRFHPVTDWTSRTMGGFTRQRHRIRRKVSAGIYERWGYESALQLGYNVAELLRASLSEPADLYIAHSEPAMWVAAQLVDRGRRVGIDMEDWFSEDLLPESRKGRPIGLIKGLERTVLRNSVYAACPSEVMSCALADEYQCKRPTVIYSAFPWSDREKLDGLVKDRRDQSLVSLHWFSQTIGPGRGLEDLFQALPLLNRKVEVHLRGLVTGAFQDWLDRVIPNSFRNCVIIHGLVHNDELLSRIAEHDIGLSLDPTRPPNRNMAVPNKLLQYILGGLAIVASNTAGHAEIAKQTAGAVSLYESGNPESLASTLNQLMQENSGIARARELALHAARQRFCWENVQSALTSAVDRAFQ